MAVTVRLNDTGRTGVAAEIIEAREEWSVATEENGEDSSWTSIS